MKNSGSVPLIFLIGVFILGNSVINLPFAKYGGNALFGLIIAVIISFPLFILLSKARDNLKSDSVVGKVFTVFFSIYCLFSGLICMRNFITFSDKVILPEISSFFPVILYLFLVYILSISGKNVIIKTAFVSGLVILFVMLFLFIISVDNMKFKSLIPSNTLSLKGIVYEGLSYFCLSFAPSVILIGFLSKDKEKVYVKGYLFGIALLLLTFLQSVAIMGYSLTSALIHPYASSISIITLGNSYSRMEGFSYFIYFAASLIKTTLCVYVAKDSFCAVIPKVNKYFLPAVLSIFGIVSIFVSAFKNIDFIKVAPFILLPLIIILPYFLVSKKLKGQ